MVWASVSVSGLRDYPFEAATQPAPPSGTFRGQRGLRFASQIYISRLRLRRRVLRTRPLQAPPLGRLKSQLAAPELTCMKSKGKIKNRSRSTSPPSR